MATAPWAGRALGDDDGTSSERSAARPSDPGPLGHVLALRTGAILEAWRLRVQDIVAARELDAGDVSTGMAAYVACLARLADRPLAAAEDEEKRLVEAHVATRFRQGFEVDDAVREYAMLGEAVAAAMNGESTTGGLDAVFAFVGRATRLAVACFARHASSEQLEKRALRAIDALGDAAPIGDASNGTGARLSALARLVARALGAEVVWIHLLDGERTLLGGTSDGGLAPPAHLADLIAAAACRSRSHADAMDSERDGLHACAMHAGAQVLGVLSARERADCGFALRERELLVTLSERVGLAIARVASRNLLEEQVIELAEERVERERLVATMAHDLRGPISAARLGAQVLARRPRTDDQRSEITGRMVATLDRADRMLSTLLDEQRSRAAREKKSDRPTAVLADVEVEHLVRDTVAELATVYGPRFQIDAEPIRASWNADLVARALWNLCANAVHHGDRDAPVHVSARCADERVLVSVSNSGAEVPRGERETVFMPYARGEGAGQVRGWGLGLTSVRDCAEAHGGRVLLESARGCTTFSLELPRDPAGARERGAP